jgi:uncharacterized phage-associated protein
MRGFNYKKTVQALNFFAVKNNSNINKMKAIKLIWLADRIHLREYGRLISGDTYYALPNGPVPSATRDILENSAFLDDCASEYAKSYINIIDKYNYCSIADVNFKVFSDTDKEALNKVFETFGEKDHFELSSFSHLFPEWKRFESALTKQISSRFEIQQDDFFLNIDESSGLFIENDPNNIALSKQMFEENSKLLSLCQ